MSKSQQLQAFMLIMNVLFAILFKVSDEVEYTVLKRKYESFLQEVGANKTN